MSARCAKPRTTPLSLSAFGQAPHTVSYTPATTHVSKLQVLEEAERSLHDALCVIRCLVHKRALVPGGAAPEMAVEHALTQWAKTLQVRL